MKVTLMICAVAGLLMPGGCVSQTEPSGERLKLGDFCYTMMAGSGEAGKPIGVTFQSVTREQVDGKDALTIVVHQHMFNGKFDMRDSFLVHRRDLTPISLNTDRDGSPHVHLDYTKDHVRGWKMAGGVKTPIDVALTGPVWDGNLWGETFAALPLEPKASLKLPMFQYDSGLGMFYVSVVGRRSESIASRPIQAWAIRAGVKPSEQVDYTVSTRPGLELSYSAGPSSQHLGGDCVGVR